MTNIQNRQVRLAGRPVGLPKRADWEFTAEPVPEPGEGEVLVKVSYLSLDPAMRGWMNEGRSYIEPVGIGEVMRALGVGQVISSRDPLLAVGDFVSGLTGVQECAVLKARHVTKVDPRLAPLPVHLNVLGMPGMTAYFGLFAIGEPKAGETVVVSGAAGAVGATVGQLAKITGCRVIGIAGGRDKCKYIVDELGFDAAIDYKSEDVSKRLQDLCPNRIDVYFDNVGGDILDACLAHLAMKGRIVLCGAISQYNTTTPIKGPSNYLSLLVNRGRMKGMVVMDYAGRFEHAVRDMAKWMAEGKLKSREDVAEGLEAFPETLLKLFSGENFGKLVLKVA
jgi:hypothetical protein